MKIKFRVVGFFLSLVKWIAAGCKLSNLSNDRLEICYCCIELEKGSICRVCGCKVKLKTKMLTEECPLKKW